MELSKEFWDRLHNAVTLAEVNEKEKGELLTLIEKQIDKIELPARREADAKTVEDRIARIHRGDFTAKFTDAELIYAAHAFCPCGAGMGWHGVSEQDRDSWLMALLSDLESRSKDEERRGRDPVADFDAECEKIMALHLAPCITDKIQ